MKVTTHSYGPGHIAIFINGDLFAEFDMDEDDGSLWYFAETMMRIK